MKEFLLVFSFGSLGVLLRYGIGKWGHSYLSTYQHRLPHTLAIFPWFTFSINILGSFLIGAFYAYFQSKNQLSDPYVKGLLIGLLGGFTTFSSFSLETLQLWQMNLKGLALIYISSTFIFGILICFLGYSLFHSNS
jgi:CrcB protein